MPQEKEARITKYNSLIENTTDNAKNAGLLETIKADNTLSPKDKSGILRKFFEKNQKQYPEVVRQIKTNDAETALKEAKSTQDLAKIDKNALTENSKKRYEKQQAYFKGQEAKTFAKFEKMIEKSEDMSQVRAKLSNNPEFDKLSQAQKNKLIGKINQRETMLDSKTTPAKKPSSTKRIKNWVKKKVDNIKTKLNNGTTAKTIAKFEKMIEKSDDYAKTRTEMEADSNFQKLSDTQKQALRDKLEAYENMQKLHDASTNANNVSTESELHKTTKNTNNPDEIATKNSVGKLGENKFAQIKQEFSNEVDAITSLDDPNIAVLRRRAESLSSREQSRALENILNNKLKELKPEKAVETPKTKQITNHDKNKIVNDINKAKNMADLDAQISALQKNGFFDNANPQQVKSVNNAISAKRAKLGKKQVNTNNNIQKTYEDFARMIEKSNDMSQVRAKLSNNPEFDKLSQAQKNELIGKINQRDAMLENQKAMAENKPVSAENKQTTTTKKGIGSKKPVKALKASVIGTVAQEHKVDTDTEHYMIDHPEESYQMTIPENKSTAEVVAPETEELADTGNVDTTEDNITNPEETNAPEEPEVEPEEPQASPNETQAPEEPKTEPETPQASPESTVQNSTTSPTENNTKANDASAPSESSRVMTDKTSPDKETVKNNSELETTDTEPDIPAEQKRDITNKVLQARSEEDIADALTTLRKVGRFKGRKNLRRLLKAKRRNNQERADKYEQRVRDNQEQIDEAYKKKYAKKFEA